MTNYTDFSGFDLQDFICSPTLRLLRTVPRDGMFNKIWKYQKKKGQLLFTGLSQQFTAIIKAGFEECLQFVGTLCIDGVFSIVYAAILKNS